MLVTIGETELSFNLDKLEDAVSGYTENESLAARRWLGDGDVKWLWFNKYFSVKLKVSKLELAKARLIQSSSGTYLNSGTKRTLCLYCDKIKEYANELLEMDSFGVEKEYIQEQDYISHANTLKDWVTSMNETIELIMKC